MKTVPLPPYHLFQMRGDSFVFDLPSSCVMSVTPAAFEALAARRDGETDECIFPRLAGKYGVEQAEAVKDDLGRLAAAGLLTGQVQVRDAADTDRLIQSLVEQRANNITLSVAEACNLRCKYCYIGSNGALNNGLMTADVAYAAVDFAFSRANPKQPLHIAFFGGEPLLNRKVVFAVIEYALTQASARGQQVRFSMTSNATLIDDEIAELLRKFDVGVMVSVDGGREIHDQVRVKVNGQGSFDDAMRGVDKLKSIGRRVHTRCTMTRACLDQQAIVDSLEAAGFNSITVVPAWGTSTSTGPFDLGEAETQVLIAEEERALERLIAQLESQEDIRCDPFIKAVRDIGARQYARVPCGVGRGTLSVGIDGNLYPCHRYVGMSKYVIGDIWSGVAAEKLEHYFHSIFATKTKCETCWAARICRHICPWYLSHEDGSAHPPPDWYCAYLRGRLEKGMWLYHRAAAQFPAYIDKAANLNRTTKRKPCTTTVNNP